MDRFVVRRAAGFFAEPLLAFVLFAAVDRFAVVFFVVRVFFTAPVFAFVDLVAVDFFAVLRFVVVFFAAPDFALVDFAVVFFVVDFLAVDFFAAPLFAFVDLAAVPRFALDFAAPALALVDFAADLRVVAFFAVDFFAAELVRFVVLVAILGSFVSLVGTQGFRGWKAVPIPFAANTQSNSTSAQRPARRAEVYVGFEKSVNCKLFGCNRFLSPVSL